MGIPEGKSRAWRKLERVLIRFEQEQVLQRLIPPVRLTTLSVSNTGSYVAGGTADGRIFLWEVSLPLSITER